MVSPDSEGDPGAGVELCELLTQLKNTCGLSYERLADE
jgi:hypothetical protein